MMQHRVTATYLINSVYRNLETLIEERRIKPNSLAEKNYLKSNVQYVLKEFLEKHISGNYFPKVSVVTDPFDPESITVVVDPETVALLKRLNLYA